MASEYIVFDDALRDRFVAFAAARGLDARFRPDAIAGWLVELPDEIDDDTRAAVDAEYEAVMDLQRELVDAEDGPEAKDLMGVHVHLPNGEPRLVRLPAAYARRLLERFTVAEIHDLVTIVARDVAEPASGPLCRDP